MQGHVFISPENLELPGQVKVIGTDVWWLQSPCVTPNQHVRPFQMWGNEIGVPCRHGCLGAPLIQASSLTGSRGNTVRMSKFALDWQASEGRREREKKMRDSVLNPVKDFYFAATFWKPIEDLFCLDVQVGGFRCMWAALRRIAAPEDDQWMWWREAGIRSWREAPLTPEVKGRGLCIMWDGRTNSRQCFQDTQVPYR